MLPAKIQIFRTFLRSTILENYGRNFVELQTHLLEFKMTIKVIMNILN